MSWHRFWREKACEEQQERNMRLFFHALRPSPRSQATPSGPIFSRIDVLSLILLFLSQMTGDTDGTGEHIQYLVVVSKLADLLIEEHQSEDRASAEKVTHTTLADHHPRSVRSDFYNSGRVEIAGLR